MSETDQNFQDLLAKNRKLEIDIRILTTEGFSFEKINVITKYRDKLKGESALDDLVRFSYQNEN